MYSDDDAHCVLLPFKPVLLKSFFDIDVKKGKNFGYYPFTNKQADQERFVAFVASTEEEFLTRGVVPDSKAAKESHALLRKEVSSHQKELAKVNVEKCLEAALSAATEKRGKRKLKTGVSDV